MSARTDRMEAYGRMRFEQRQEQEKSFQEMLSKAMERSIAADEAEMAAEIEDARYNAATDTFKRQTMQGRRSGRETDTIVNQNEINLRNSYREWIGNLFPDSDK